MDRHKGGAQHPVVPCLVWTNRTGPKCAALSLRSTSAPSPDGRSERIRLWGIDCPESRQAFGTRAKQFTGDLAFGRTVTVRVREIDRYKRFVGEVILPDARNLNMSSCGPGWHGGISITPAGN